MNDRREPAVSYVVNPPEAPVDLTLAMRVLHELAHRDGDLGGAYWDAVIKLLASAGQMHTELLELRRGAVSCARR